MLTNKGHGSFGIVFACRVSVFLFVSLEEATRVLLAHSPLPAFSSSCALGHHRYSTQLALERLPSTIAPELKLMQPVG